MEKRSKRKGIITVYEKPFKDRCSKCGKYGHKLTDPKHPVNNKKNMKKKNIKKENLKEKGQKVLKEKVLNREFLRVKRKHILKFKVPKHHWVIVRSIKCNHKRIKKAET